MKSRVQILDKNCVCADIGVLAKSHKTPILSIITDQFCLAKFFFCKNIDCKLIDMDLCLAKTNFISIKIILAAFWNITIGKQANEIDF